MDPGNAAEARSFDGYPGAHILRPELGLSSHYTIVVQFDRCPHLEAWMQSETRKSWIERVKPLIREPESIKMLTGLEPWLQLPGQPSHSSPKRYKQAPHLAWLGGVSISPLVNPHVNAPLSAWLTILWLLINTGITVLLPTYWMMPFLTRLFKNWLFRA